MGCESVTKVVYKYRFFVQNAANIVEMPAGAVFRHCKKSDRGGEFFGWFECDPYAPCVDRVFHTFGTGQHIPEGFAYCGTVHDGSFVWHLYEKVS